MPLDVCQMIIQRPASARYVNILRPGSAPVTDKWCIVKTHYSKSVMDSRFYRKWQMAGLQLSQADPAMLIKHTLASHLSRILRTPGK